MPTSVTPAPVIRQIVDAMRALAGPHPGFRPVHAKGVVCSGTFRASADAPSVTRAPHFTGQSVPTIVRFANANGNPDVHDSATNVRSMAVKFQLSDGKSADILANSVEGFIARTPEEFLEFLRAQLPESGSGRPDPDAVPRFLAAHPASRAFVERLMKKPVPASYAQAIYHAEHAFRFTTVDGASRFGRYRFLPQAGEAFLSPDDAASEVRASCARSWKGACVPVRWRSGCSCNWPRQATRPTTPPPCGPRVGP
jgi:catalase